MTIWTRATGAGGMVEFMGLCVGFERARREMSAIAVPASISRRLITGGMVRPCTSSETTTVPALAPESKRFAPNR